MVPQNCFPLRQGVQASALVSHWLRAGLVEVHNLPVSCPSTLPRQLSIKACRRALSAAPPVARWRLAPLGRPGRGTHSNHCVTWTASSVSVPTFQPATEPCGFLFLADLRSIACSPAGLPWSCSRPHGFSPGPRKSSPNCSAPLHLSISSRQRRLWKPRTFPWLPLPAPHAVT